MIRSPHFLVLAVLLLVPAVFAYECYVCHEQRDNNEKCIKTVQKCEINENHCMTMVKWGSTPYFDPSGSKQHYVTKQCATSSQCDMAKRNTSKRCDRIWYNDWECVECCTGDRCNFYITLAGSSLQPLGVLFLALPILFTTFFQHLNFF